MKHVLLVFLFTTNVFCMVVLAQGTYSAFSDKEKQPVFTEDFNDNKNEWAFTDGTLQGGFFIIESQTEEPSWCSHDIDFSESKDFEIETKISFVKGDEKSEHLIIWGQSEGGDEYEFGFTAKGNFFIEKYVKENYIYYVESTASTALKANAPNKLTIRKVKSNYYFFINEILVHSMAFESFFGPKIGFQVGGKSTIQVDYLKVYYLPEKSFKPLAPPQIVIKDLLFTDPNKNNLIDGGENCTISFTLQNNGKGPAINLSLKVSDTKAIQGLVFEKTKSLGNVDPGQSQKVIINLSGNTSLLSGIANIKMEVAEQNGFDADPKEIEIKTMKFLNPQLLIPDHTFSNDEGGKIKLGQPVKLKVLIQNQGQGLAHDIKIVFTNPENVFPGGETEFSVLSLEPNETKTIYYEFFANKKYTAIDIPIVCEITENYGNYGLKKTLSVSLDKTLSQTDKVVIAGDNTVKNVEIKTASLSADVDKNIPVNNYSNTHRYALIIGNEDYSSFQKGLSTEVNVDFAMNDAKVFSEYAGKTLGVPEKQIKFLPNATTGQINQGLAWINNLAKIENGEAELIFYYSGHGLPDETTKEPYLIPVDVAGTNIQQAIKLSEVYNKLSEFPTKRITVFMDACFSGGARNQSLVAVKGIKINPKEGQMQGNMVVFTSSSGEESSGVFRENQHGFFTYFLLKKLKESKGDVTYSELSTYITENVKKETSLISKPQTPQLNTSQGIIKNWESWKMK